MSVPPEIEERHRSFFISRYTYSKLSTERGDPVDNMAFSGSRLKLTAGLTPSFSAAARYLALVPKIVIFSSWAILKRLSAWG